MFGPYLFDDFQFQPKQRKYVPHNDLFGRSSDYGYTRQRPKAYPSYHDHYDRGYNVLNPIDYRYAHPEEWDEALHEEKTRREMATRRMEQERAREDWLRNEALKRQQLEEAESSVLAQNRRYREEARQRRSREAEILRAVEEEARSQRLALEADSVAALSKRKQQEEEARQKIVEERRRAMLEERKNWEKARRLKLEEEEERIIQQLEEEARKIKAEAEMRRKRLQEARRIAKEEEEEAKKLEEFRKEQLRKKREEEEQHRKMAEEKRRKMEEEKQKIEEQKRKIDEEKRKVEAEKRCEGASRLIQRVFRGYQVRKLGLLESAKRIDSIDRSVDETKAEWIQALKRRVEQLKESGGVSPSKKGIDAELSALEEQLTRRMLSLDEIETKGCIEIREKRRALVNKIQGWLGHVETAKREAKKGISIVVVKQQKAEEGAKETEERQETGEVAKEEGVVEASTETTGEMIGTREVAVERSQPDKAGEAVNVPTTTTESITLTPATAQEVQRVVVDVAQAEQILSGLAQHLGVTGI